MRIGAAIKSIGGPIAAGGLIFFATLIASAPASLISFFIAEGGDGLSYQEARGTIWNGELGGASIAGAPLGDVSFQLSPVSILRLSPGLSLSARGGAVAGEAKVSFGSGNRVTLSNVKADISLGAIAPRGLFGEPARGRANVSIDRLVFSQRAGCREANGVLWTDVFDAPAKRVNLPALPMSGELHCDGDVLVVALEGQNTNTGASVTLRIDKTLTYEIVAKARPSEESVATALRIFGFEDDNGALIYGSAGVLTGAGS